MMHSQVFKVMIEMVPRMGDKEADLGSLFRRLLFRNTETLGLGEDT